MRRVKESIVAVDVPTNLEALSGMPEGRRMSMDIHHPPCVIYVNFFAKLIRFDELAREREAAASALVAGTITASADTMTDPEGILGNEQ